MSNGYEIWISNAKDCQAELERALLANGSDEVIVSYRDVALAFPSTEPNPFYFDTPLIDCQMLGKWAKANNWIANSISEPDENSSGLPSHIRFSRLT